MYLLTYFTLDKLWMRQDVKYDFTADLTGIGDRPVHEISGFNQSINLFVRVVL